MEYPASESAAKLQLHVRLQSTRSGGKKFCRDGFRLCEMIYQKWSRKTPARIPVLSAPRIFASSHNNRNIDTILKFTSCNFRISGI